ncbi:hypothetical protein, partial [Caenispirillum bisanense]|uniref:hypothetical protein n=1 Tax=Caenispirillum bisanense TaxID=414052 RepID=UPI003CD05E92
MALSFKGLFSRKKKTRAGDDDGREPFFTGATLGPGLGNDGDGQDDGPARGFDDLLDDDAWGGDDDDDGAPRRGARKGSGRKRVALFAAIGLAAAVIGGGAAWWLMTGGEGPAQVAGLLSGDGSGDASTAATGGGGEAPAGPSAPIGSGERVSLPMPPAPGLDAPRLSAGSTEAVVDPTA